MMMMMKETEVLVCCRLVGMGVQMRANR